MDVMLGKPWVIALALLPLVGYVISRLLVFKAIFFEHAGIALTQPQVAAAFSDEARPEAARVQHIPKVVHQIFHNWREPGNDTLPADWAEIRRGCMDLNPDFEFKVRSSISFRVRISRQTVR
jgi:mannosyltransferase OCH1-like enzyme